MAFKSWTTFSQVQKYYMPPKLCGLQEVEFKMPRSKARETDYKVVAVPAEVYEDLTDFMHDERLKSRGAAVKLALDKAKGAA